jgi:hypothetical protein
MHYAKRDRDAAALNWTDVVIDYALMNKMLVLAFFIPFATNV